MSGPGRSPRLPGLDEAALGRIRAARVHVVGAGPTAGPALLYLARAGVEALYLDDGCDVAAADACAWLYEAGDAGAERPLAAARALRATAPGVEVRPYATDAAVTAVLVCAEAEAVARRAAEEARRAGLPHVVGLAAGDGGEVVAVPSGAPCLRCASPPGARLPPRPGAGAIVGALAAMELLLVVGQALRPGDGRRAELRDGWPAFHATARRAGCPCRLVS